MADQRAAPAEGSRGSTNQPVAVVSRLRGRATTEAGQPLAGVNVRANSTIFAYSALTAETDDDGWYTIEMPNAPNSYVAAATITKEYNGRTYTLDLAPSSQSSFGPTADVTRNFTMKMTGAINKELNHYWGWPVGVVEAGYNYEYDVSQVELTLVPVGPLIDGSVGKTIVARPADKHGYVRDVPIGQYRISARYMPTGKPLKLRLYREQDGAASSSVVANFDPNAKRILVEFDPK